ncbi:Alpha/Beta hydrolase protein [Pholiota molesta]|nr:Alpha/Beta hydrolase protein [Pholiota molesta]
MFSLALLAIASLSFPSPPPLPYTKDTPLGTANGVLDPQGAYRFSVKYASAARWAPSTVVTLGLCRTLLLTRNGATNSSSLPLACPQDVLDPSAYTEDCLSMVIYVPPSLTVGSTAPTLVWIHGGSFVIGSATGPGLDGSKLAIATNSIVAVIQYRLGALGYMAPNGQTNLALKDKVNALRFLKKVVPAFGGSASKITLAGQSSGANAIRALLAAPSASSLFRSAILQSDPMNYGHGLGCGTNATCLNALSLDDLANNAFNLDPAAGLSEPIRPVLDGSFLTSPLDSTAPFPTVNKPLLVTSVLNEAGPAIYGGNQIFCRKTHPWTDYLWRCSGWTFSRNWVQHGGTGNDQVPFCTQPGVVCHQDDIEIVFGTVLNPTSAQSALTTEMQKRYQAFLATGNPNVAGVPTWTAAGTTDVHPLVLGGSGEVAVGACVPTFWGQNATYDYQFFDE